MVLTFNGFDWFCFVIITKAPKSCNNKFVGKFTPFSPFLLFLLPRQKAKVKRQKQGLGQAADKTWYGEFRSEGGGDYWSTEHGERNTDRPLPRPEEHTACPDDEPQPVGIESVGGLIRIRGRNAVIKKAEDEFLKQLR